MLSKFQKGDIVRVIADNSGTNGHLIGEEGTIVYVSKTEEWLRIELDDQIFACEFNEIILVKAFRAEKARRQERHVSGVARQQNFMDRLSTIAKKVINPNIKAMIKVGWLDTNLQLTSAGEEVVLTEYLSDNEEKFGKLAAEQLKENKKDREER